MSTRAKTIGLTALATTFFWIAVSVLVLFVLWLMNPRVDPIGARFIASKGAFAMWEIPNTKTQTVTVVIEQLPVDTTATNGVEIARRELAPTQRLRIGFRELVGDRK
jgi:hypothetical protein